MASRLTCLSLNVRGLKNDTKRHSVFFWLRKQNCDVIFLQETHCHSKKQEYCWGKEWDGQSVWGFGTNNSKGVTILFNRQLKYQYNVVARDMNGRYLVIDLKIQDKEFRLINTYAPNHFKERCDFLKNIIAGYTQTEREIIYGGDHNCVPNKTLDRCGDNRVKSMDEHVQYRLGTYDQSYNEKDAQILKQIMSDAE